MSDYLLIEVIDTYLFVPISSGRHSLVFQLIVSAKFGYSNFIYLVTVVLLFALLALFYAA